jgi:hypothetical protein
MAMSDFTSALGTQSSMLGNIELGFQPGASGGSFVPIAMAPADASACSIAPSDASACSLIPGDAQVDSTVSPGW